MTLYEKALIFAIKGHDGVKRKHINEPYIVHPIRVASLLKRHTDQEETIAAALLHDLVEDVEWITKELIYEEFGFSVGKLVDETTDHFTKKNYPELNREQRKKRERDRQAIIQPEAKKIKLADLIDNVPSIVEHDRGFAFKYVPEKALFLDISKDCGSQELWYEAYRIIEESKKKLGIIL